MLIACFEKTKKAALCLFAFLFAAAVVCRGSVTFKNGFLTFRADLSSLRNLVSAHYSALALKNKQLRSVHNTSAFPIFIKMEYTALLYAGHMSKFAEKGTLIHSLADFTLKVNSGFSATYNIFGDNYVSTNPRPARRQGHDSKADCRNSFVQSARIQQL